jgi:hypothetical protein
MEAHAHAGRALLPERRARQPQTELDGIGRSRDAEHDGIADRLDVLATRRQQLANGGAELVHESRRVLVAVGLRERREPGDVREGEGRGCLCHTTSLPGWVRG